MDLKRKEDVAKKYYLDCAIRRVRGNIIHHSHFIDRLIPVLIRLVKQRSKLDEKPEKERRKTNAQSNRHNH